MSNVLGKGGEKAFEIPAPHLSVDELAKTIYEATTFEKKLGRFQGSIKQASDIKDKGLVLCSFLIQENILLNIVNLILEHSIQNGFEEGVDLNNNLMDGQNILDFAIRHNNYEVFKKLIALNVNYLSHNSIHMSTGCRSQADRKFDENEVRIKKLMTSDLLELGAPIKKETIEQIIRFSDASFLQIIADSDVGKKLMTAKFLKTQLEDSSNQHFLKNRPEIQTALMILYNKQRVIETIQEDEGKDEIAKATGVAKSQIKAKVDKIITSPEFIAEIVEEILKEKGQIIKQKAIDLIKQKLISNPQRILEKLFEY